MLCSKQSQLNLIDFYKQKQSLSVESVSMMYRTICIAKYVPKIGRLKGYGLGNAHNIRNVCAPCG